MTKERLEEIRKRKYAEDRIVYTVFDNDEEATALHIVYDNELLVAYIMLKRVYETKEEAEWYCKMNAERTERFEPPMWEDIYQKYVFRFIHKNTFCMLRVEINRNIEILQDLKTIKIWDTTKENYEKACEIVRDLFKEAK